MMTYGLQQEETPIDGRIANALIEATPEWWEAATLDVERVSDDSQENLRFTIRSPEGHRDYVEPTDEIYTSARELSELFKRYGHIWTKVKYIVTLQPDGDWKYTAEFEYE
jgi:hypothetical protein